MRSISNLDQWGSAIVSKPEWATSVKITYYVYSLGVQLHIHGFPNTNKVGQEIFKPILPYVRASMTFHIYDHGNHVCAKYPILDRDKEEVKTIINAENPRKALKAFLEKVFLKG